MTDALIACRGAVALHWHLGVVSAREHFAMIGWRTSPPSVDGGIPVSVVQVLATALASIADIAFIGADGTVITARSVDDATQAFDLPQQPWTLQAQTILLLQPRFTSIALDRSGIRRILSDDWKSQVQSLAGAGVVGAVRPGVDGDVAGICSLTAEIESRLIDALSREARKAGFAWIECDESAFAEALAAD
ncbi:hypothetical protein [Nevskia sp.]|uniref:hypothetical protein n=1 Tax=Nevskia sp. TaxID=1929292 RepID=UPI0025EEFBE8|nr:hypothetical protein [Nevskia sp.]